MNIKDEIKKLNCGEVIIDANLKKYNTYNVDSQALAIFFPNNIEDLKKIILFAKEKNKFVKILGNGSNLVFANKYYDYFFINLKNFNKIEINDNNVVADGGVSLIKLAYTTSKKGLSGLEFASGIPGSVGGSVYMNAGAYNASISDILVSAKVLNDKLEVIQLSNSDFSFDYRYSILQDKKNYICLEATFKLKHKDTSEILDLINDRKKRRLQTQPLDYPSAGSVFRNPSKDIFAGKLIEDICLKGKKIGGAMISEKHANFVINCDNATGKDIKNLILYTQKKVNEKYNIELKIEQEFVD